MDKAIENARKASQDRMKICPFCDADRWNIQCLDGKTVRRVCEDCGFTYEFDAEILFRTKKFDGIELV